MRWTFAALLLGGVLLNGFSAHAEGDAEEAPPSPGQVRHLPAVAETTDTATQRSTPRLPATKTAARTEPSEGQDHSLKPLLPADYRPHGDAAGPAPKETNIRLTPKSAATDKNKDSAAKKRIPLAPSAAEFRRELALRNGGPDTPPADNRPTSEKLADKATSIPNQRRSWPTTVTNTAGPTSPAGAGSAQDRKGTVIEATGPQQGVIRNRW